LLFQKKKEEKEERKSARRVGPATVHLVSRIDRMLTPRHNRLFALRGAPEWAGGRDGGLVAASLIR
jgi:hypothetical protein